MIVKVKTMTDDPILLYGTAVVLILMPILSYIVYRWKRKWIFFIPAISMLISFPMFFFVVIVPDIPISKYLFYTSMILWTGGFFTTFFSWIIYATGRKPNAS